MKVQFAQFNIATLREPIDHPASKSFVELLDATNARAEISPGFVWRHGIDSRDTDVTAYDDPRLLVNASVWESAAELRDFVYKGFHRDVFRRRAEWFTSSASVMWWIPAGEIPTLAECKDRLAFSEEFGATAYAFGNGQPFGQLVMRRHRLDEPVARVMLGRLNDELRASTPADGVNFFHVAADDVADGNGAFVIAWLDGEPKACGAWRRIDDHARRPGTAEIKRMWADPAARGHRLGAAVLATLQTSARAHGATELRLETGEYLAPAVGLYRRFGFAACEPWGDYVGAPHSYTMSKPLAASPPPSI